MADPLATLAQVKARLGLTLTAGEDTRLTALILDASAAVRSEAGGQYISSTTSTIRARLGCAFTLPQHPVTSITSITRYDPDAVGGVGEAITFEWDGLNGFNSSGWVNRFDYDGWYSTVANITYVHGYDPVPDDIVAVVSQMAGRAFGLPSSDAGVTAEGLAPYNVAYGSAAGSGPVGFLSDERAIVQRYRRPRAPISMLT